MHSISSGRVRLRRRFAPVLRVFAALFALALLDAPL